jgi:hypothetical protein
MPMTPRKPRIVSNTLATGLREAKIQVRLTMPLGDVKYAG